jgi:aminobenzoyl-glutamate transport protein
VPLVALAGVLSSLAADAGYVVLIPLAALLFRQAGRSPLTGIAVAFAGVSGGFSANLLLGPVDALLAGISTEAARTLDPTATVSAAANYWFMLASVVLVVGVVTLVTTKNHRLSNRLSGAGANQRRPHPDQLHRALRTCLPDGDRAACPARRRTAAAPGNRRTAQLAVHARDCHYHSRWALP